jgi:UV DNA damage repair endonuclease
VLNAIHLALHTDAVTVAVVAHDEAVMEGLEGIVCSQDGMLIPEHAGYRTFRRVKRMSAAQNALTLTREEDGSALALTARMIALAQRFGVPVYEPSSEVLVDSDLADEIARAVLHAISPRLEAVENELREMQRRVSISRGLTVVAPTGHREAPRFDAPARLRG